MPTLSIGACISFGWNTFKKRAWFLILIPMRRHRGFDRRHHRSPASCRSCLKGAIGATFLVLVRIVMDILVAMGTIAVYLKVHDAPETAHIQDLWHPQNFWKFVATYALVAAIALIGFVSSSCRASYSRSWFCFSLYVVIDRGSGPRAALKESARITKGNRWNLLDSLRRLSSSISPD